MAVQSLKTVLRTLTTFITNFVNNTNNPTGVTAAQIDCYTKTEVDNIVASKLTIADVPITYWGQSLSDVINVSVSGAQLQIKTAVPSMLGGVKAVLPITNVPFTPTNNLVNYIYLIANNGQLTYTVTTTVMPEDSVVMYLGSVKGNGTSGVITDMTPVVRIAAARLSNKRRGSAIPVTDSAGGLQW